MKQFKLLFILAVLPAFLYSQNISVKSFRQLPNDLDARVNFPKTDQNGDKCSIIKVQTTENGFVWDGDQLGIIAVEKKVGEYWLYIPHGAKRLTIKHDKLGVLRDYAYSEPILESSCYEMVLTTGRVTTIIEDVIESQWLVINSEPDGADVYINDQPAGKTPFQNELPVGKYTWRVSKELYLSDAGVAELTVGNQKNVINLKLKPNYGTLSISSTPESGAVISLNGIATGKTTPSDLEMIPVGDHTIRISKNMYETTSRKVTLEAGQNLPVVIEMKPTFSEITIGSEPLADIYVNSLFKANGTWKGQLNQGVYTFEARLDKHNSAIEKKTVNVGSPLSFVLKPTPKTGSLKIVSQPYEATISIDGADYGTTPNTIKSILIGEYTLILKKQGYNLVTKKVTITENNVTEVNETLLAGNDVKTNANPQIAAKVVLTSMDVTISSNPSNLQLTIDGIQQGQTPKTVNLSFGRHKIKIINGKKTLEESITVVQNGKTNFDYTVIDTEPQKKEISPEKITSSSNSGTYISMLARDASIGSDALFYNPAGLTKLSDGFHLSSFNQFASQKKTIENTYSYLNNKKFSGEYSNLLPSLTVIIKKNKFALGIGLMPSSGDGITQYNNGLPSFEKTVAVLPSSLTSNGIPTTKYSADINCDVSSYYLGAQMNASIAISENVSISAGARLVFAKNTYDGSVRNIMINPNYPAFGASYTGVMVPANQFFTNAATSLTSFASGAAQYATGIQPIITAGAGGVLLSNATSAGLTAVQISQIQSLITSAGVNASGITISQAQTILNTIAPVYTAKAAAMTANANATKDQSITSEQTGSSVVPVFGANITLNNKFNLGIRYELKSKLTLTNKTTDKGTGLFPDGEKIDIEFPALLSVGFGYKVTPNFKISSGMHYFFTNKASVSSVYARRSQDGTKYEFSFGLEVNVSKKVLLSAGYLYSKADEEVSQSDLSHSLTSNNLGFGLGLKVTEKMFLNLGLQYSSYSPFSKNFTATERETYNLTNMAVALGVDFNF